MPAIKFVPNTRSVKKFRWYPEDELRCGFPEHVEPKFLLIEREGALAAIVPLDDAAAKREPLHLFFHMVWHYGREIFARENPEAWSDYANDSYSIMWFLFRRFHRTKSYSSRRFNTRKDYLNGRGEVILPWNEGDSASSRHDSKLNRELLGPGAARAMQLGVSSKKYAQKLHYGMSAAARRHPWVASDTSAGAELVRDALLARQNSPDLDDVSRSLIEERLIKALVIAAKSKRDIATFDKWLLGSGNTLAKQLSRPLKASEGDAIALVHRYLDEQGICAMKYLSPLVQALMTDVERGLDEAGVPFDRVLFRTLYYPMAYFDNLPLIFLREKLEFFEGTIESLRVRDESAVTEFHTMLWFYSRMVEERRRVDRERSPSRALRRGGAESAASTGTSPRSDIDVERLIEMLVADGTLDCECDSSEWLCLSCQAQSMSFRCKNCHLTCKFGESR
ncbi:hypothetical protein [Lacipirellula parvula]|uniref:hypothetical protein n=1 Tax=Lacipirellula parvula TaxID=2650471 RepID=UPI001260D477|nr:hypothetical protein [Lacipirellula parvula]